MTNLAILLFLVVLLIAVSSSFCWVYWRLNTRRTTLRGSVIMWGISVAVASWPQSLDVIPYWAALCVCPWITLIVIPAWTARRTHHESRTSLIEHTEPQNSTEDHQGLPMVVDELLEDFGLLFTRKIRSRVWGPATEEIKEDFDIKLRETTHRLWRAVIYLILVTRVTSLLVGVCWTCIRRAILAALALAITNFFRPGH